VAADVPLVPLDREDEALVRSWAVTTALTYLGPVPSDTDIAWRRERTLDHRITVGLDDGQVVATFRSFDTTLVVPGGRRVDVDAVSGVTVLATHRRRGLLSRWMGSEISRAGEAGLMASVLVASEAPIYGRYGYGPAAAWCPWTVDARRARWRDDAPVAPGSFRAVDGAAWAEVAADLHDRASLRSPGSIGRADSHHRWLGGLVPDLTDHDKGRRFLLHRSPDGEVDGAAVFKVADGASWDDGATLRVHDLLATDDAVEAALVRFLCEVDFITSVELFDLPPSWSVPWFLTDPRAATSGPVRDGFYVRLHDVPAALTARRYPVAGTVVLDVADAQDQVTGRYRLVAADDGTATCERVDDGVEADLHLDAAGLASLWLGGGSPSVAALVAAGRARPLDAAAVGRVHALFSWPQPARVLTHF
jgi:predicted acetyltransferase